MAVFPGIGPLGTSPGSYGGDDTTSFRQILREYDDRSYRRYSKSSVKHRVLSVPFKSISKTRRDLIEAFFIANWNLEFFIYCWPETSAVDPSGVATTGRHLARFADAELSFSNQSTCRYDCTVNFVLLS